MRLTLTIFIALLTVLLIMSATESSGPWLESETSGTLSVNGQTVDINYAYAKAEPGEDGLNYHIILSDVPVDAAKLNEEGEMWKLSRAGELHYLLIHLNSDNTTRIDIRHPAFKPLGYLNAGGSAYQFEADILTSERIEAHAYMKEPASGFGDTWSYDVRFSAQVIQGGAW